MKQVRNWLVLVVAAMFFGGCALAVGPAAYGLAALAGGKVAADRYGPAAKKWREDLASKKKLAGRIILVCDQKTAQIILEGAVKLTDSAAGKLEEVSDDGFLAMVKDQALDVKLAPKTIADNPATEISIFGDKSATSDLVRAIQKVAAET